MTRCQNRIRVLRIIARMNVGGPAVQVAGLTRHLDVAFFNHRLLTGYCDDDEADYLLTQAPDIEAIRVKGLGRSISFWDDLRAFSTIRREIIRFRPHVVHTHTAKAGVLGRVAALSVWNRPKLVHTFHGHLLHGYFGAWGTRIVIMVERMLGWCTDVLVAVGPEVRDDLLAAGIGRHRQFRVVEPGLELREYPTREEARRRLGLEDAAEVVSVLGRITRIKRPDRMVEVVSRISRDFPRLQVIVAGSGDLLDYTRAQSEALQLPIRFLGWREDVEVILAASDVTLLTSDNEGTPLSLIQAALLGVPAVTTDVGSVRHIVRDGVTGWLAEVTVDSLVRELRLALSDSDERQRRGNAATAWASEHFGVDRLASDYADIYRELASA